MILTKRDKAVIEFVKKLPCFSDTIQNFFFKSQRVANKRLTYLANYGYLKRTRKYAFERYFYFTNKEPAHKTHMDYLAKAYCWVWKNNNCIITDFSVQRNRNNIEPDLLLYLERDGECRILPVEIELGKSSNIDRTIKKYEDTEFKKLLLFSSNGYNKECDFIKIIDKKLEDLR